MERSSQVTEENKEMKEQNFTLILETYKNEIEALKKTVASMNVEIQILKRKEENGSDEPLMVKKKTRTVTSQDNCGLCQKFKTLDIQPKDSIHHLSPRGNIEPESCGHLREMNVKQMAELYKNYKMCRVCAYKPLSDSHQEEKCKFTVRVPHAKCKAKGCAFRFFLCDEHTIQNGNQLQHRREYYKKSNFPFKFAPEKSNQTDYLGTSKKEEVRRKSNTSTQTEEEPDSWTSELESEDLKEDFASDHTEGGPQPDTKTESPPCPDDQGNEISEDDLGLEQDSASDDSIQIIEKEDASNSIQITNEKPQPETDENEKVSESQMVSTA